MTIEPFSPESLARALSNKYTSPEVIQQRHHYKYFLKYLGDEGLNAQSLVIEEKYISKDFLHDYAAYYALCFREYDKFCKRVHFFRTTVTEELLNRAILEKGEMPAGFWNDYLGFIVVKPIPTTVIGFTVLKHYNMTQPIPDRNFWGLRNYKVHVFGREIEVPSLAFQEQDSVLAACATTAIWSMLNKAASDFHTILKTPSEITRDAGNVSLDGSRLFPNKGLSVLQICQAIFNSGLVSEVKLPNYQATKENGKVGTYISNTVVRKFLNAYSPLGIPIILVVEVPDRNEFGLHAITISGFRQSPPKAIDLKTSTSFLAENIDRIYAHDDQWGPFVRVDLKGELELKTMWTEFHKDNWATRVKNIIIPLYPKVRIAYEDIETIVLGLDAILSIFFDKKIKHDLVWDIKINFSEMYKSYIRGSGLSDQEKIKRLITSLPKYLWIATCYIGIHKVFEFTFDATDVNNGMIGVDLICLLPDDQRKILSEFLAKNERILRPVFAKRAKLHYYDFLIEQLK